MNGAELLEKIRNIKHIDSISWDIMGDYFNPDVVWLIVHADGEEIRLTYGEKNLLTNQEPRIEWMQTASVCLFINKAMELMGRSERFCVSDNGSSMIENNISDAVNFTIHCLQIRDQEGQV